MKIKFKLNLVLGLLFGLTLLLSAVCLVYVSILKSDTEKILADNYISLEYGKKMLLALEENTPESLKELEANLRLQEKNITEPLEGEATKALRQEVDTYKNEGLIKEKQDGIRKEIYQILEVNMDAIRRKGEEASLSARSAYLWIGMTGTCCILIAFTLLLNLPSNIGNPISDLTRSIREIAAGNYSERVHHDDLAEFGELAASFNTMAERLEEYKQSNVAKLMMEKKRIETLINNMHDPVLGLDEQGRFLFLNNEALRITALKPENVLGKTFPEVALHNDLIRTLVQDLTTGGSEKESRPIHIFADGKESYFTKEIIPILVTPAAEEQPRLVGNVILLQNITRFKELDVAKTHFIATISHELKTPIASMKMSLQLLENEKIGHINPEQKQLIHSVHEDAERLLKITSELLNLSQVETGNIQLTIQPSDPSEILQYAIQANRAQAEQKGIKLEVQMENPVPAVQADSEKTAWILTNLISNAIRYSFENSTVLLKVWQENGQVLFSVKDNGPGIEPSYHNRIFDRYFRVPGSQKEGSGLGLAISKEFIEAQGGTIRVDSSPGNGSTFTLSLKA
ncbi:MAG TPA: ATP-binding protein [Catalimonadaceae bacterium]|nr:ATP-binding protein [Catalimonadaceae bacterium]HPI10673.1 ATP-binding protein [Catalimonadaceae bacterium]